MMKSALVRQISAQSIRSRTVASGMDLGGFTAKVQGGDFQADAVAVHAVLDTLLDIVSGMGGRGRGLGHRASSEGFVSRILHEGRSGCVPTHTALSISIVSQYLS